MGESYARTVPLRNEVRGTGGKKRDGKRELFADAHQGKKNTLKEKQTASTRLSTPSYMANHRKGSSSSRSLLAKLPRSHSGQKASRASTLAVRGWASQLAGMVSGRAAEASGRSARQKLTFLLPCGVRGVDCCERRRMLSRRLTVGVMSWELTEEPSASLARLPRPQLHSGGEAHRGGIIASSSNHVATGLSPTRIPLALGFTMVGETGLPVVGTAVGHSRESVTGLCSTLDSLCALPASRQSRYTAARLSTASVKHSPACSLKLIRSSICVGGTSFSIISSAPVGGRSMDRRRAWASSGSARWVSSRRLSTSRSTACSSCSVSSIATPFARSAFSLATPCGVSILSIWSSSSRSSPGRPAKISSSRCIFLSLSCKNSHGA
eukprot:RCo020379